MDLVRDAVLGVEFEIDPRFARLDAAAEDGAGGNGDAGAAAVAAGQVDLPTAHFIAARPAEGWIAALASGHAAHGPATGALGYRSGRARALLPDARAHLTQRGPRSTATPPTRRPLSS
ncbi:MAG: hypothetical protein NTW58_02535 [Actinobacteria bacterium]|nr:hypothetical protein [Actinomycetota bacterium]